MTSVVEFWGCEKQKNHKFKNIFSQMFTSVVKKCLNLTFKVNFYSQKLYESFWFFFSLKNISLGAGFLLLTFFKNLKIFEPICFLKWGPIFDGPCKHLWKSNQNFYFTNFFAKIYSLLTHAHKTPPLRSH